MQKLALLIDHGFIRLSGINNLNKPWCFKVSVLHHIAGDFTIAY